MNPQKTDILIIGSGLAGASAAIAATEKGKNVTIITKTKTLAAYGQIVDILFANKKFPITVDSTPVPEGRKDPLIENANSASPALLSEIPSKSLVTFDRTVPEILNSNP